MSDDRDETQDRMPAIARRDLLTMGAALGLASACTRAPREEIVPYVRQPADVTPGKPRWYATTSTLDGYATGVLALSREGRPTKIEGNPDHPASLGAAGPFEQASVLGVYDPSRLRAPKRRTGTLEKTSTVSTWPAFVEALGKRPWAAARGRGLHLVLEPTSSPSVIRLLTRIRERWPETSIHFHAPFSQRASWEGARVAFGSVLEPRFDLSKADVIVSLDADFLGLGPASLRLARQVAEGRRLATPEVGMNRIYVAEPLVSVTGAYADHRARVRASDIVKVAAALLASVGRTPLPGGVPAALTGLSAPLERWVRACANDLSRSRGRSAVLVGASQPPVVHAIGHALNGELDNGAVVTAGPSPIFEAGAASHGIEALSLALEGGAVDTLLVLGTNVVYSSPADRPLGALFARAKMTAYLGLYEDETARACDWMIPAAHPLESWGDARAFDGTVSIVQPLIAPLYGGKTLLDVLAAVALPTHPSSYDQVVEQWNDPRGYVHDRGPLAWRRALTRGVVDGSALTAAPTPVRWESVAHALARTAVPPPSLELVFAPDPRVHDGRFTNNAWLLELPAPVHQLTWTNAATISVEDAEENALTDGDEIDLRVDGRSVRAPVLVVPGQAPGAVGLTSGWGREGAEELARGRGANAFAVRSSAGEAFAPGLAIVKTRGRTELPIAQQRQSLEGRDEAILRHGTLRQLAEGQLTRTERKQLRLYHLAPGSSEEQWAMSIDLTACTGCGACVVACQAENNIPTVGRDGVLMHRQMHWLRIDTYLEGDPRDPEVMVQPMLCQHCESAPCEYVCPVNATVHSADGLNQMVYNRCVGTRFCSNNCPYKVRRFNWFDFHRKEGPTEELVHNPDVTVRQRGVMEKCTFCVQRIRQARHDAGRKETLQTACQQTCPTKAIVFGNITRSGSEVARLHANPRAFSALDELGTLPRIRYLARIKNPNPELG